MKEKIIDLEKAIRSKNPSLFKMLPGFILNYLKRKIHEDEVNAGMEKYKSFFGHDFNDITIDYLGAIITWEGQENIPAKGGVVLAGNHPLGGLDGVALIKAVSSVRYDVRFIVNDLLKNLRNFGELFVGVNKVGASSASALKVVDEVYSSDHAVLVFPAGLVSRKQQGKIRDLAWKKSFISKSIKHNKPIIPVYIKGQNSAFFYNLALWRKRFGVKANIEMFFLPDEMFKQKGRNIHIIFGEKIEPEFFDKRMNLQEWADNMREFIYEMPKGKRSFKEYIETKKSV